MRSPKKPDPEIRTVSEEPELVKTRPGERVSGLPRGADKIDAPRHVRRKTLRVNVMASPAAAHISLDGRSQLEFRVRDLSEFGISFYPGKTDLSRSIGGTVQAMLSFGEVRLPVVTKLLYQLGDVVGAEFVGPSPLARSMIRTHFFLEFIAARLVGDARQTETEAGPCKIVTWGAEGAYGFEVVIDSAGLRSIEVRLGHLGATVQWRGGEAIHAILVPGVDAADWYLRGQLITLLINLGGMNPRLMEAVERIFNEEKIVIEYHG